MPQYAYSAYKFCPICGVEYKEEDFGPDAPVFVCHKCKYKFFQDMKPTISAVIPNASNPKEVMIAQRGEEPYKGKYNFPGGFYKYGERPEDAIKREMKEEFDLDIEVDRFLAIKINDYPYAGLLYKHTTAYILAKPIKDLPTKLQLEEVASCKFANLEDRKSLEPIMALKPDFEIIEQYLGLLGGIMPQV